MTRLRSLLAGSSEASLTKRLAGTIFIIRVVSAAMAYLSQILLARWMGGSDYGVYVYVWTWVLLLGSMMDFGISASAQKIIPEYRAGGEHHGVHGREVIQLAAKSHHLCQKDEVSPSESTIGPALPGKKEQQGKEHEQGGDKTEHLGLGLKIGQRRKQNIAAARADIVHQLEEGKVMPPLPEEVRRRDDRCQGAAQPEPAMAEAGTKLRQANANHDSREPEDDGIFVQDGDPRERAYDKPKRLVSVPGDAYQEVGDTCPKQRVEGVHGE